MAKCTKCGLKVGPFTGVCDDCVRKFDEARVATQAANQAALLQPPQPPSLDHPRRLPTMERPRAVTLPPMTLLGGYGYALLVGGAYSVVISDDLGIESLSGQYRIAPVSIPIRDVVTVDVSGPGAVQSGGGFVGGGIGLEEAAIGMAAAAVLNAATTTTTVTAFLSVVTSGGELHFECSTATPSALHLALSQLRSLVRAERSARAATQPSY
jgi:hypothetical protein